SVSRASGESYIGVSTPVTAHSVSRVRARALRPTWATTCRRDHPVSSEGLSSSSLRSSASLREKYAWPRRARRSASRMRGSDVRSVRAPTSDLRDDLVAQLAEPRDARDERLTGLEVARRLAGVPDATRGARRDDVAGLQRDDVGDVG